MNGDRWIIKFDQSWADFRVSFEVFGALGGWRLSWYA